MAERGQEMKLPLKRLSLRFSSHLSALIKAVHLTSGDVLELGMGAFSTPVLHNMCVPARRKLVSYDNDKGWVRWAKGYGYEGEYHEVIYVDDWAKADIERPWDVVLADHSPDIRRKEEIKRLAKFAKYIIIHDSNEKLDKQYRYSEIYPLFKYRADFTGEDLNTTVLSNLVDLRYFKSKTNDTIDYIAKKFNVNIDRKPPIEIHGITRESTAKTLNELGFREGAEVGVAQGDHAKILCDNIPGLKLHCVDIWDEYLGYNEYTGKINRYYQIAKKVLNPYGCNFIKKFSMDAVKDFKDGSLDFVYIDGAHDFKSVADDICEWSKKVRVGGVVFGHDYKRWRKGEKKHTVEVKDVVQAYCYTKAISPWFVLKIRKEPSWLFVRQQGDLI